MAEKIAEPKHVDPTALGLFGLGIVTLVASSQKLGLTTGTALVIPWAIFLGALAQIVAGVLDYKKGNVFGATAFCGYGFFWLGMAMSWMTVAGVFGETLQAAADTHQLGFVFIGYLVLSIFLTVGSTAANKLLFWDFIFIDILFIGLAVSTLLGEGGAKHTFHMIAAVAEIIIAAISLYGAGANVLNNHLGRTVISFGKAFGPLAKK